MSSSPMDIKTLKDDTTTPAAAADVNEGGGNDNGPDFENASDSNSDSESRSRSGSVVTKKEVGDKSDNNLRVQEDEEEEEEDGGDNSQGNNKGEKRRRILSNVTERADEFMRHLETNYKDLSDIVLTGVDEDEVGISKGPSGSKGTSRLVSICGRHVTNLTNKELEKLCMFLQIPGYRRMNKLELCRLISNFKEYLGDADDAQQQQRQRTKKAGVKVVRQTRSTTKKKDDSSGSSIRDDGNGDTVSGSGDSTKAEVLDTSQDDDGDNPRETNNNSLSVIERGREFLSYLETHYKGLSDIVLTQIDEDQVEISKGPGSKGTSPLVSVCGRHVSTLSNKELERLCVFLRIPGYRGMKKLELCWLISNFKESQEGVDVQQYTAEDGTKMRRTRSTSKQKSEPTGSSFWAIRSCDSLKGPAIFTHWDDCSFYLDQNENDCEVEYKIFHDGLEALKYLAIAGAIPDYVAAIGRGKAKEKTTDNDEPLVVAGTCRSKRVLLPSESASPARKRQRRANESTTWEQNFQLYLQYKEEFGDERPPNNSFKTYEKYKGIETWISVQRINAKKYLRDPYSVTSENAERARKLLQSGLKMKKNSTKAAAHWEEKYQQAKDFLQTYGDLEVTKDRSGFDQALQNWLWQQKSELRKYENDQYTNLSPERAERLRKIGVESVQLPIDKAPEEVKRLYKVKFKELENKLILPLNFSYPTTLTHGGSDSRNSGEAPTNYTKASVSGNPDEDGDAENNEVSKRKPHPRLKKDAMATEPSQFFFARKSWNEYYEKLKEYKEIYGTCDIIPNTTNNERFGALSIFVYDERRRIRRVLRQEEEDPEKIREIDRVKVKKLLDLGFVLEAGTEAKVQAKKLFKCSYVMPTERAALWEATFEVFKRYKDKHGTCKVDRNLEGGSWYLMRWVQKQAKHLRYFEEDNDLLTLNEERVLRLKDLGLTPAKKVTVTRTGQWDEMYEQLKQYKEEHGHVNVPSLPKTPLRCWILTQRDHFEKMKAGKKSKMTPERLALLAKIGLPMRTIRLKSFEERAADWYAYKNKHGKDPPSGSGTLGNWVASVRKKYAWRQTGKRTSLTQKQVDLLNGWGFRWSAGIKKPTSVAPPKSWDERFQEMLEYKRQNGHLNVPQAYPVLGNWVHTQRKEFSLLKRGRKSAITPEQIEKLRSVGFIFITRKSPLERLKRQRDIELGLVAPDESEDDNASRDDKGVNIGQYW